MSLIMASLDNFERAPITGIGFGVPTNARYFRPQIGFMGMPVGASVEKGFMPSAVLEEIGLPGAIFTLWIILTLAAPVIRQPDLTLFWVLATSLIVNFGEMVFFSVGGMGFYFWLMMAFAYSRSVSMPELEVAQRYPEAA